MASKRAFGHCFCLMSIYHMFRKLQGFYPQMSLYLKDTFPNTLFKKSADATLYSYDHFS